MTAVVSPPPAREARLLPSVGVLSGRALRIYQRTPQIVILRVVQAVAFLLIFRYVFGGAIASRGMRYIDFMAPGIIVVSVMFATMGTAVGVAEDHVGGLFDRLRSLPMPRSAVLTGRVLADLLITVVVLIPTVAIAFAVGFRVHAGWGQALAAFGILVYFAFAFVWIFVAVGLLAGSVQAAQGITFTVLPLSFASSAFVPTSSMPGWLQAFTEHQPVTAVVNSVRVLTQGDAAEALLGHSTSYYVIASLLWITGLTVLFAALAINRYRRS
jgi:ABC-2 type transport system permease protein